MSDAPHPDRPEILRNWARSKSFAPATIERPASLDELRAAIGRAAADGARVKVFGAGHSWSDAHRTDGCAIVLDRLRGVTVDVAARRASAQGGARLNEVNRALTAAGLALENLGSISEQTLAGAIATGTHGSGVRFGIMATQVVAMTLVTADGEARDLRAESAPELFAAARVGFGAFGVVAGVTVACERAFDLAERTTVLPFGEAFGAATLATVARNDHAQFFWLPHTDEALLIERNRVATALPRPSPPGPPAVRRGENAAFGALLALGDAIPGAIPTLNRLARGAVYKSGARVDRSDLVLNTPLPPRYVESEYAIPIERTAEAMGALRALIEREGLRLNFPIGVRFTRGDELWMSPAYGRASCFIGLMQAGGGERVERAFAAFEALMKGYGGRPHWGKIFHATPAEVRAMYPETYERFAALLARTDPTGVFRTPFVDRLFPVP
ncbi:MAG: FAD-linked oxidoreductase [Myxococcaceae bacterium]|nr:FAD-linked oxidoreductase [Myxococcaceae bacterium]